MANPNPNTSGLTPFKKGCVGNPGGKTSKQRKAEIRNAEKATLIRERLLDAIIAATDGGAGVEHIEASILKLVKDSEDRGLGQPKASVDVSNEDGSLRTVDPAKLSMSARKELLQAQMQDDEAVSPDEG